MATWMRKGIVLLVLAILAGCSLPFGGSSSSNNNSSSASASPSTGPGIAASKTLSAEFWFEGFHVTLGDVAYKPPAAPTPGVSQVPSELTIAAKFENLGKDTRGYFARMSIASNGQAYTSSGNSQKLPDIPGKSTANGVISFDTDEKFNLDDAVLTIGEATGNQPVIPLGKTGTAKTLQPRPLQISGAVNQANEYTLNVTAGVLSYDDVVAHRELDTGTALITINYSTTGTGMHPCCISRDHVQLKVPDGTSVEAEVVETTVAIPSKGTTRQGDYVTFIIKLPAEGAYDAIFNSTNTTGQSADIQFTITASGTTGGGTGTTQGTSPGASAGATPSVH